MPKSLMHTVRGYRTGKYHGGVEHGPHVMTTRSGLSIKKVHVDTKPGSVIRQAPPTVKADKVIATKKKHSIVKYKSMSYMSFVTRFYLCLRAPELDLAGVNPRETLQYSEMCPFSSYDDEDSDEDETEEDEEEDDDEDIEEIETCILNVAENLNNNEKYEHSALLNSFGRDGLTSSGSEDCATVSYPFEGYPKTTSASTSTDLSSAVSENNGQYFKFQFSSDVESQSTIDSDAGDVFRDIDSEFSEDTSSICSDTYVDVESSPLLKGGNQVHYNTQTMRLGDLQIKLIDGDSGQKVIKCQECEKVFTMMALYTTHLKTHMKIKNTCYLCGKIFSRSWLLKGHLRTHTGEKPFPCPYRGCSKAFADKSNLRSHLMIHTVNSKNYNCQKCGRAFAQKRYLHKHMLEVCRLI